MKATRLKKFLWVELPKTKRKSDSDHRLMLQFEDLFVKRETCLHHAKTWHNLTDAQVKTLGETGTLDVEKTFTLQLDELRIVE